jgi:hypothetical protein
MKYLRMDFLNEGFTLFMQQFFTDKSSYFKLGVFFRQSSCS